MRCERCRALNGQERRYCRVCGDLLRMICGDCGFDNLPGDRFCGGCGLTLDSAPGSTADSADAPIAPNRLVALKAELPPAPREDIDELYSVDITELEEFPLGGSS